MLGGASSMLGRMGKGAALGAGVGWMSQDGSGWRGAVGGAAGGALFGAAAPYAGRALSNRLGSFSSLAQKGLGYGARGARGLANYGAGMVVRNSGMASNLGSTMFKAGSLGQQGFGAASAFMGGPGGIATNKYGGMALAALGLGSSAYIGSSMLSSNQGRRRY